MTGALKFWDGTAWQFVGVGPPGPAGATGPAGPTGPTGPSGANEIATRLTRSSSAAVTLPTNAWTKIPLDTVVFDTAGNADVANTRVKISAAGKYRVTVSAFMTNGAGGPATMQVGASINGATASGAVAGVTAAASQVEMLNGSDVFDLKAGDTVELMANCSQANGSYTWNANVNYLVVEKIGAGPQGPKGDPGAAPEAMHWIGAAGEPAFTSSWVNSDTLGTVPAGGTNRDAGYYKDRGRVYLTGVIKSGASGSTAFTLPVGYRPKQNVQISTLAGNPAAPCRMVILATGAVQPTDTAAALGGGVNFFTFLDGTDFLQGA